MRKRAPFERYFRKEEIDTAIRNDKILTLSLKLPVKCNLKCKYCYASNKIGDLKAKEIIRIIVNAVSLGIKSVSILGEGEPLMYKDGNKDIFYLIDEINRLKIPAIIFTNNTLIDKNIAEKLVKRNTVIIAKLNSLDIARQKLISGEKLAAKIFKGLQALKNAGFNRIFPSRLAIHSVIIKDNYDEICDMWQMCRQENIIPYFQVFAPPTHNDRNRKYIDRLHVPAKNIRKLFYRLKAIDKDVYGFQWDSDYTYPIPALGCCVIKSGCAIDSFGNVKLCAYVDENLGNIKKEPLQNILRKEYIRKIRRFNYYDIKRNRFFYGCRALTFNITGDRFLKDPFFWKK